MWEKEARVCSDVVLQGETLTLFDIRGKILLLTNGPILISARCELNYRRPIYRERKCCPLATIPVRKDPCRSSGTCCPSCAWRRCRWSSRSRRRRLRPAETRRETISGSWGCADNSTNTTRKTDVGTEKNVEKMLIFLFCYILWQIATPPLSAQ